MRILLVCSSLEPGRDGVGDYTRALAEEFTRQGHACALLALHDRFLEKPLDRTEPAGPCFRLPATFSWTEKMTQAGDFRAKFSPDWISLHFVPYGYQDRGLVFGLGKLWRVWAGEVPLHVMFHELWIGAARGSSLRARVMGALQRQGVRQMLQQLEPRLVTTSIPVYVTQLEQLRARPRLFPHFGSLPIWAGDPMAQLPREIPSAGIMIDRSRWWLALFFAAIYTEWRPEPLLHQLELAAKRSGRRVCLVQAGRAGAAGEALWQRLERAYAGRFTFLRLGERPPAQLSALMQAADFGISTSPWELSGKSGSVADMLMHGLPVLVARDDYHLPGQSVGTEQEPLLVRADEKLEDRLVRGLPRQPARARLPERAALLLSWMNETS